MNTEKGR